MTSWVIMFITSLIVPLTMVGFGYWYTVSPPKFINLFSGYRTSRSMKSQEAWDFAQKAMGKLWLKYGVIMVGITILVFLFLLGQEDDFISWMTVAISLIQIVAMMMTILPIERALKKNFDDNGNPIER